MKKFLSYYNPKAPLFLAYMLQQVEYNPRKFLKWVVKIPNLTGVMHRQRLVWTFKAYVLVVIISCLYGFYLILTISYFLINPLIGLMALLVTPFMVVLLTFMIVLCGWLYYEEPRRNRLIKQATKKFKHHKAIKVAIAGSYGKTSMKELLATVLGEAKNVAATPGNKNVPVSHAAWAKKLTGKEDILLIEYGEGAPGDIEKLAKLSQPDYAVITGLAPNHLDEYKNLDQLAEDLLKLKDFVKPKKLYINGSTFKKYEVSNFVDYSGLEVLGWKISKLKIDYSGTSFEMSKKKKTIKVASGLIGRHQAAPLAMAAALAFDLDLKIKDIEAGLAKTVPFEHRMQPRQQAGAWIIDDTYNGSIEGIKAGLDLLNDLPAKRKTYVTPGLVDQGTEKERVHIEIGQKISQIKPDKVVLMQNSTTEFIVKGLEDGGYKGDLQIEADPLTYYTNLEHRLAGGDLVVLQNDWTDNYS